MNTKVAKKQNNKGFTLIELIVVIAIIAVLAAILAPQYLRYVEKSRVSADVSTAKEIMNAVQTSCANEDAYASLTLGTDKDSTNGTRIEWYGKGNEGHIDVTTFTDGNNDIKDELTATFGDLDKVSGMKSKVWQNAYGDKAKGWNVYINQGSTNGTVVLKTDAFLS